MDLQSPLVIALAVAVVTSVSHWAYTAYILKDPAASKVFVKTLASGLVATALVVLYVRQFEPTPSLRADPFFEPL